VRDFAVTSNGLLHVYNGTFSPSLSTLNPATSVWTHQTFPGWSTVGATYGGGVTAFQNYAYATDMLTFQAEENGLIRFNMSVAAGAGAQRFAQGGNIEGEFIDVTLGYDGLLYGLWPGGSPIGNRIDVHDPLTLAYIRTINLPVGFWGISVNSAGHIFGVNQGGGIWHLAPDGSIVASLQTGISLTDIDRSPTGQLLIGSPNGVYLSSESLNSFTPIPTLQSTFVSFTTPVPEPTTALLTLLPIVACRCGSRAVTTGRNRCRG
jgi:hypothetical protein